MKAVTVVLLILAALGPAYIVQTSSIAKEIGDLDSETHASPEWRPERGTDSPVAEEEEGHQGREELPCKSTRERTRKDEMTNASRPEELILHPGVEKEESKSAPEVEEKLDALLTEGNITEATLHTDGSPPVPVTGSGKSLGREGSVTDIKADYGIPPETGKESTEGQKTNGENVETNTDQDANGSIVNISGNNGTNYREEEEDLIPGITIDNRVNNDTLDWAVAEKRISEETEEDKEVSRVYVEVEKGEEEVSSEEKGRMDGEGLQRQRGAESCQGREKAQPEDHKAVTEEKGEFVNNPEEGEAEREEAVAKGEEDVTNRAENENEHFGESLLASTAPPPGEKNVESLAIGQVANQSPTQDTEHSISWTTMEPTTDASRGAVNLTQAPLEEETGAISLVELQLVEVLNMTDSYFFYPEEQNSSVSVEMEVRGQATPITKMSASSEHKDATVKDTIKEKKTFAKKLTGKSMTKPNHSHDDRPTVKPEEDYLMSKVQQTKIKSRKPEAQSKEVTTTLKPKELMTKSMNFTANVHLPITTLEPEVSHPTSRPSEPISEGNQLEESMTITVQPTDIPSRTESTETTKEANSTSKPQQSEQQLNKAQPELQITKPTTKQLSTPEPLTTEVQPSPEPTPKERMYTPAFNLTQVFTSSKPLTKTASEPNTTEPTPKPLGANLTPNQLSRKPILKPEQSKPTPPSQPTPPQPATTSIPLVPVPPTKPTLNPFSTTPTVKPAKTQPILKSKPTLNAFPTTPTVKPAKTQPILKSKPTLKPFPTTPTVKPAKTRPILKSKPTLNPFPTTPTVKPAKTRPTLKSKPMLKPQILEVSPKTTSKPIMILSPTTKPTIELSTSTPTLKQQASAPRLKPQTSTPRLKPLKSTPRLKPQTSTPRLKPQTSTPRHKPQTSAPRLEPLTFTPRLKPQTSTPTLTPLTSTATLTPSTRHSLKPSINKSTVKLLKTHQTLKPLKSKLQPTSQMHELSPKTTSKPIIVLPTSLKPTIELLPSKPLITKPTLKPFITKPVLKPLIPKPTLKLLTSKPTQQSKPMNKSKLFKLFLETTSKPIMSGHIYKQTFKSILTTPTLKPIPTNPTLKSLPTKPTLKPIPTKPTLKPLPTKPTLKPLLTKPTLKPLLTKPTLKPLLTKPTLKPSLTKPLTTKQKPRTHITESTPKQDYNQSSPKPKHITLTPLTTKQTSKSEQTTPTPKTALLKPAMKTAQSSRYQKNKQLMKNKRMKKTSKTFKKESPMDSSKPTSAYFPYFEDNYCPSECACYGKVVQCSDKGMDKIPYGIPYNSRYILLMNNHITTIQLDLLGEYSSMEFLVLTSNQLTDSSIEGAFEGVQALKRLYLDRNLLESVPVDLPKSLEELRLDNNHISMMTEAAWARCPGLLVLSLRNNSLGNGLESLPTGVLSPLGQLRTLSLDQNRLVSVPLGLPLSIKEMYLRGNLIRRFRRGAFTGTSELMVLDLSANRLTNKGLLRESLLNTTHLESLNLEGNRFKHVPRHLPPSLKTLNLEGNRISAVSQDAFLGLSTLEHLGLARNRISRVAPGAFKLLPVLHQLDLCHNALRQVPRQLPAGLHSAALTHNRIESVPRDAFCWAGSTPGLSSLVLVQLEHNLIDLGNIDTQAFKCLRGFQVVHLY